MKEQREEDVNNDNGSEFKDRITNDSSNDEELMRKLVAERKIKPNRVKNIRMSIKLKEVRFDKD